MRALQRFAPALLVGLIAAGPALPSPVEFPTDRVIVRVNSHGLTAKRAFPREELAAWAGRELGEKLEFHRTMGDGALVMRLPRRMTPSQIRLRAKAFAVDGATVEIDPDRIAFPQQSTSPNDPLYGGQWNLKLEGINLPPAWGFTTGSPSVVIAVLDTGMLGHADLAGRFLPGYDFIGDTNRANDGDGREANATDPGDWVTAGENASGPLAGCPVTDSRWHGTLMAGVIAANAGNNLAITGINWGSKVLPVRVVGKCGGYTSDIADGMRWAAGLPIPEDPLVPANPNPAKILNVSLAAASPTCETAFVNAIAAVTAAGTTVVVSAGNSSGTASQYAPGNCSGVITVGATDIRGGRPGYANTGDPIALSAPGGVGSTDPETVRTLGDGGATSALNDNAVAGAFGTSIAAAHVTGVASLLLSLRPNLTPQQVRDILVTNARPFPTNAQASGSFADCTTATCGAGILNAGAAVVAVTHPDAGKPGISAGREHTVALRANGTLVAWGPNNWGQLGDGTTNPRGHPATVNGIDGVVQVAAGGEHTLALRIDGSVWAWGRNDHGQLGNGTIDGIAHPAPVRVSGLVQVTSIAAGENHSAAITRDGKLWLWGHNPAGALAIGPTLDQTVPAVVPGLPFVASVAAGYWYTCASLGDGTVRCWGFLNPLGGFGFSGGILVETPTAIANLNLVASLSPGPDATHRVALDNLGTLRGFGANENGQLGVTATAAPQFASPGAIAPTGNFTAVAAGARHTVGLTNTGVVMALGDNAEGQLGRGNVPGSGADGGFSKDAQTIAGTRASVRIAAAGERAFAVRQDGSVVGWGAGWLGTGGETAVGETTALRVPGLGGTGFLDLGITTLPADAYLSTGFTEKSDVAPSSVHVSNPATLLFDAGFPIIVVVSSGEISVGCAGPWSGSASLSAGDTFCLRVTASAAPGATVSAFVSDSFSIVSRSFSVTTAQQDTVPTRGWYPPQAGVAPSTARTSAPWTVTGIDTSIPMTLGLGVTASVGCTGSFVSGSPFIANGQSLCLQFTTTPTPGAVDPRSVLVGGVEHLFTLINSAPSFRIAPALAVSGQSVLGLRDDGNLFAWGDGRTGQLGGGSTAPSSDAPLAVPGLGLLQSVAVSSRHAAAVGSDGTVWTWGSTDYGQGGRGFILERTVPPHPVPLVRIFNATKTAVGINHTLALDGGGNVWAWGRNNQGQVGSACTTPRCATPVQVLTGASIVAIAAAGNTSYAIDSIGTVRCWGRCYGPSGYVFQSTPTVWNAISGVRAIASTTGAHWVALMLDGTVRAWGENWFGQLGNNATLALPSIQSTPVTVAGLSGIVQVAAGGYDGRAERSSFVNGHSLALKGDGTVWAWGDNEFGQLGDGTLAARIVPVPVAGVTGATAIGAGWGFSAALKADGRVLTWGREQFGELGNGDGFNFTSHPPGSPLTVAGVGASGSLSLGVADNTVFAPQTDVPLASVRTSNAIVGPWANGSGISIAGGSGQYSIGCTATFTSAAGTIASGATVCVRLTAPATLGTSTATTLTIAGVARTFTVTTIAGDTTPDVFRLAPAAARPLNALVQSAPVTITGITGPVPVTVMGGEYATPCGANPVFTNAPGAIAPGQTLCVRRLSAGTPDTVTTATLSVGTRSADFHVITAVATGFAVTPKVTAATGGAALRSDGTVFAWGFNSFGEVGDSTRQPRGSPVALPTISGVTTLDVGRSHTLALRSDGSVWAWGDNADGRLGDGTEVASPVPLRVNGLPAPAIAVAASYDHSVVLLANGQVWGWGNNFFGQLATGNIQSSSVPVQANITGIVVGISTGLTVTLALKQDGTVWCWGNCLESGGTTPQTTPVQVGPGVLTGITEVAGSGEGYHYLARKGGTVFAWGSNASGQVGNGTTTSRVYPPVAVTGLANVTRIALGQTHSLALVDNAGTRTLWSWGDNDHGQLGLGTSATDGSAQSRSTPQRVGTADGATSLDAGVFSSFALMPNGDVLAWGIDSLGSLGNGKISFDVGQQSLPVRVLGPNGDGYLSAQFVDTSPNPFAFVARFGVGPNEDVASNPVRITGLSASSPVSFSGAATDGWSKNCTGTYTNAGGTIANNETVCVNVRASGAFEGSASATLTVGSGNGARSATFIVRTRRAPGTAPLAPQVALGTAHTVVLATTGTASGAGYNANGQLGNGTTLNTPTMQRVPGLTGLRRIAAGAYHSLAIDGNGAVFAWGYDIVGQLGQGSTTPVRATPLAVPGLANAVAVAAGDFHSLALLQDGTVRAWGSNFYGQVGDGTTTNRASPTSAGGALANVIAIAAGGFHSLALLADGTVRAWGANDSGQLGDNTTTPKSLPTPVPGLTNVVAIAAGTSHSLALRADGTVWAWGANGQGQLGQGNTTGSSVPVPVSGLGAAAGLIAAGGNHSLAVKAGGALFSWGANANGQLGDGLNANRTLPFAVATPAVATAIAAGARHSAALDASGRLYVWGDNFFGQVGNRSGNFSPHSASLNVLRGDSRISTGAGGSGSGTGTASSAGSSLLTIAGIGAGFAFDPIAVGAALDVPASYRNASLDLPIGSLAFSTSGAGFGVASGCSSTLPPDEICDFTLSFSSANAGTFTGALRVDSDLVGAPEYRDLEATAVVTNMPSLALAGTALSFAPTTVGTVGGPATLAVTNKGTATLSVQSALSSSPAFGLSHDCTSVAPGASCTISATYAPSAVGASTATATIVSNGGNASIALYGTGIAPAYDAVPDAFSFVSQNGVTPGATVISAAATITGLGGAAPVTVANGEYSVGCLGPWTSAAGTIANGQSVCVRHVAGAFGTSTVTTLTVGGVGATFTSTSVVSQTLTVAKAGTGAGTVTSSPGGVNCGTVCSAPFAQGSTVALAAAPGAGSTFAGWSGACTGMGSCNVTMDTAKSVTATFDFSASAGVLTANPASLDFGGQSMNTTAPARTMTLTNTGGSALTVNAITASSWFAVTHNCGALAAGASCTTNVSFTPGAEGALFGTLTVDTNAGVQGFSLAGTGERSLVTHYYNAILRRAPDAGGKSFWESERVRLQSLGANVNETWYAMATFFFFSTEYQSFNRDDAGFVTDLYNTFFNRAPDAGGLAFWTGQLAGGMPREVVLVSFMFSNEFQAFTQAIFGNTQVRREIDTVVDFYRGLLSRLPDDDGFAFWVARFRSAQCAGAGAVYQQADSISGAFANSPEYQSRNRTNAQYVGDLYNAFLRRGGDLGGVQFWINEIATGSRTRDKVRQDFIASPEFNGRVLAIIAQGCLP